MQSTSVLATLFRSGCSNVKYFCKLFLLLATTVAFAQDDGQAGRYLDTDQFVASAFPLARPAVRTLWVAGDLRDSVEHSLGHRFAALRVRYWYDGDISAWVLDEIGKELPITIGVTVREGAIVDVRVLVFRESRGWEVRFPFFTDQFRDSRLDPDGRLSHKIDGITGATLSVGAVTRVAKIALLLDDEVRRKRLTAVVE
jgi:hypothetical protein